MRNVKKVTEAILKGENIRQIISESLSDDLESLRVKILEWTGADDDDVYVYSDDTLKILYPDDYCIHPKDVGDYQYAMVELKPSGKIVCNFDTTWSDKEFPATKEGFEEGFKAATDYAYAGAKEEGYLDDDVVVKYVNPN